MIWPASSIPPYTEASGWWFDQLLLSSPQTGASGWLFDQLLLFPPQTGASGWWFDQLLLSPPIQKPVVDYLTSSSTPTPFWIPSFSSSPLLFHLFYPISGPQKPEVDDLTSFLRVESSTRSQSSNSSSLSSPRGKHHCVPSFLKGFFSFTLTT